MCTYISYTLCMGLQILHITNYCMFEYTDMYLVLAVYVCSVCLYCVFCACKNPCIYAIYAFYYVHMFSLLRTFQAMIIWAGKWSRYSQHDMFISQVQQSQTALEFVCCQGWYTVHLIGRTEESSFATIVKHQTHWHEIDVKVKAM